ncbi:MAG: cytidylate kinase-like family protein [Clostridia bacterium]|nr:cytidylate kinase-like family protein [Clostridia bacterium]
MKCNYITIEREYGSGGTFVARKLAEQCGIACYGREILEEVSKEYNISPESIEQYEETVTNSFLYSMFIISRAQAGDPDMLANEGHIYVAEQLMIKKLAARGRAIFLGHCASEALKDRQGVVKVFIRSSKEDKTKRIMELYNIDEKEVELVRKKYDKKRANYFYANTAKTWDDFRNYDIVLDVSNIGIDGCVAALRGILESE